MRALIKQCVRQFIRFVLSLTAVMFGVLILLQLGLIIGINFLATGNATHFVQGQINALTADSGYTVTFKQLSYGPIRGLILTDLVMADKRGKAISIDLVAIKMNLASLMLRALDLSIQGQTLTLLRLPEGNPAEATPAAAALQPLAIPDVFFHSLHIARLSFDHLDVDAAVAGKALHFAPVLKADLTLSSLIKFNLELAPHAAAKMHDIALPETILLQGSFNPATLELAVDQGGVFSDDYSLSGKGNASLAASDTLNFVFEFRYPNLTALTQSQLGSAFLTLTVAGTSAHPALQASGTITPASLEERGFSDVIITAMMPDAQEFKAALAVQSTYKAQPVKLNADIVYDTSDIILQSLHVTAPGLALSGRGKFFMQNALFDGKLYLTAKDIARHQTLLGAEIGGDVEADITFQPLQQAQSMAVHGFFKNAQFYAYDAERIAFDGDFADTRSLWPRNATILVSNLVLTDKMSLGSTAIHFKKTAGNAYELSLDLQGRIPSPLTIKGSAAFTDLTEGIPSIHAIDLTTTANKSTFKLTGAVDAQAVDLQAVAKNFLLADIMPDLPAGLSEARLTGALAMTGTPNSPLTTAKIVVNGIQNKATKGIYINTNVSHRNGTAALDVVLTGKGIRSLTAHAAMPLTFTLSPFAFAIDPQAPISGKLHGNLELSSLAAALLPPAQKFSGVVKADGQLRGTLAHPDIQASASLESGAYKDEIQGIRLMKIRAEASFDQTMLTLRTLTATDGEYGRLTGQGVIATNLAQSSSVNLKLDNFHLPRSNLADGLLSASIAVSGDAGSMNATGTVDVVHMNIRIPEKFSAGIPELNIVSRKKATAQSKPQIDVALAITINAPNQVFVRGWGLNAEFGGMLQIGGSMTQPLMNGVLESKRGRYEEFGKRFTLEQATLRFQGAVPPSPYLDIKATVPADGVEAAINLAGPIANPVLKFFSVPQLPEDEVLARILFGRTLTRLTPFQAIQLAQTLRRFTGQSDGDFDALSRIRSVTGLDDISVNTNADGQTSIGAGKYLTDNVYLELERGKAESSGAANVQIEITPSMNVQSKIDQTGQTGGGIFWTHDY